MKVKQTPIAAAVTLTLLSAAFAAQAQDAASPNQQLDTVVVTGVRASLATAVNVKRNAAAVVDAVSAEDVGKLPDSDVGESLGRIPGVSVDREFGQGSSVSIRGSDPQMTYTTLNGQTVASTGWYDQKSIDRSFNYSLLPSELIGGMEVYKSSQADLTEGGIGGTVIIKTRKPLDLPANTAFVSAKLGKGTVSTEPDKDASGLYSWRDDKKMFGVLLAGAVEKGEYIRRGIESDTRWSGDVEPTTFVQERRRTALNVDLQARPAEGFDLNLNYLKLSLTGDNSNTSQYIFQQGTNNDCTQLNAAGVCVTSSATAATANPEFLQTWARKAKMSSDSLVLNGTYKTNGLKLEGVVGSTKADGGTSETTNYSYYAGNLPSFAGSIDATGKQIKIYPTNSQDITLASLPGTIGPAGSWATTQGPNSDKETFAQADATLDLDWGAITSFKTGLRTTKHDFTKNTIRANFVANAINVPTASLYDGTIAMGTPGWSSPKPNIDAMMANTNANITSWTEARDGYGALEEKNTSAYGMFEIEQGPLRGNFGLRYIHSNVTASGYKFDGTPLAAGDIGENAGWSNSLTSQTASYHDFLPSLNLAYELQKNTILRFAASKAITRPNFDNMFLATEAGFQDQVAGNETITYGSPALKPMKSAQIDLGIEYYYGRGNLLALTYFHKSIDNFITALTQVNQQIGVVSPDSGKDSWTVNRYVNAGGGNINGLETQINHAFDNGFGVAANYTYTVATAPASSYQDQLNLFTDSSKHNVNLVGYWENSVYSARLAYNWRSKYMLRETGWYGNRMHDAYGTLDLSLGWNITDKVRLSFDALNLLKQDDIQYGAAGTNTTVKVPLQVGYPAWSFMGETTYRVGLSAKF
jgi:iron complex outermembrane receptor protein